MLSHTDLPDGAVLIEFLRFHVYQFGAVPSRGESRWGPPRYLAFVLPSAPTNEVMMYDLGLAETIDGLVSEFRSSLTSDPVGTNSRDMVNQNKPRTEPDDESTTNAGDHLYNALLAPLLPSIGDRRRLIVAPDGDLNRLPFEVLPVDKDRRLIEEFEVSYVTVGRDLRSFALEASEASGPPLVLADPDFDSARGSGRLGLDAPN